MRFRSLLFAACLIACPLPATAQDCTNPNGPVGLIKFNLDHDVLQVCTKRGWRSLHPAGDFCPGSGLVGYWKFNEATGSTTAADSSGNGNTGTLTGMDPNTDWVAGKLGNALDFDPEDKRVNITSTGFNTAGNITLSAWIYPTGWGDSNAGIIFNAGSSGKLWWRLYGTTSSISIICNGSTSSVGTNNAITLNQWQHVAVIRPASGAGVQHFVNGQEVTSTTDCGTPGTDTNWAIGDFYSATTRGFDGLIDDMRVYNRALDAAEITALYNSGAGCQ